MKTALFRKCKTNLKSHQTRARSVSRQDVSCHEHLPNDYCILNLAVLLDGWLTW